jgi:hypothetical protein
MGEFNLIRGVNMSTEQNEKLEQLNQSLETLNFYARLMAYGLILMVIMVVFIALFSDIGIY